jgi:uncharacterized membrane protein YhaH (DUF805 family)
MGRHMRNRTPREEAAAALDSILSAPWPNLIPCLYFLMVMPFLGTFLIQASLGWLAVAFVAHVVFLCPVGSLYRRAYGTETTWSWYLQALAIALGSSAVLSLFVVH